MNRQPPPHGIEWTRCFNRPGWTSNPIRGCMHQCQWRMPDGKIATCYAKTVALKFKVAYPHGFEHLSFHPEELEAWRKLEQPSGIFLDSMADVFGAEVEADWIAAVLQAVRDCPQHIFFALTKNPPRLPLWSPFPPNLWVGISSPPTFMFGRELSDAQQHAWFARSLDHLASVDARVRWLSLEPLTRDWSDLLERHRKHLHWAVIGAASDGSRTHQPDREHLAKAIAALNQSPHRIPIFFKGNLDRKLAEEVAGGFWQRFPDQKRYDTVPYDLFADYLTSEAV